MDTSPLIERLEVGGRIGKDDVLALRRELFADRGLSCEEARAVFRLNRACAEKDQLWHDFFVEELTYYFIYQTAPRGYLSEENARFLIEEVTRGGGPLGAVELTLVVNIIEDAHRCPETLIGFALGAVKDGVLHPKNCSFGNGRAPGVITDVDVEIVRSAIHGTGGGGSYTVTRREAELLFDLSRATRGKENAESWRELFASAVGSHLLFPPAEVPEIETTEEIMERREWFAARAKSGSFLRALGRALASRDFGTAVRASDFLGRRARREEAERRGAEEQPHAVVNEKEAAWLLSKVGPLEGLQLSDDERALLAFVRTHADAVHVSLDRLMAKAGLGAPKPTPCHRSGHAA